MLSMVLFLVTVVVVQGQDAPAYRETLRHSTNQMRDEGTLMGTVDQDRQPLANSCVEIRDMKSPSIVVHGCTNGMGTFEVHNLPAGKYEVTARSDFDELRQQVQITSLSVAHVIFNLGTRKDVNPTEQYSISPNQMAAPDKARKAERKAWDALRKFNFADARKNAALALQLYPRYADALVITSILDLQDNQFQSSIAKLEQAINYDSGNAMAYFMLASTYNATARFDDALQALSNGIRLRPDMWQGYFESARAEIGKGDFGSAVAHLNRAKELVKDRFPLIHLHKGRALLGLHEFAEGATELQVFLEKEPTGSNAEFARKMLQEARSQIPQTPK